MKSLGRHRGLAKHPGLARQLALLAVTALLTASLAAPARAEWPQRPIQVVVPYSAGAMGDTLIRLLSDSLRHSLGQPVIVDNRPGAGGNIGASLVSHAAPDGYTLLVGATNNFVINQFLYKRLGFDPLKAFDPVTVIADVPSVIFIGAQVPARTFAEFETYAKANPDKVNYGSPGAGTTPHLSAEAINRARGLGMLHVPYRGSGQGMTALLGNEVQFYLGGAGLGLQHVHSGKLRALAVASKARLESMPDTPTFQEVGLDDTLARNWWGLAAPAGTPPAILDRLNAAVRAALEAPAMRARLAELGVLAAAGSRVDTARQWADEAHGWARMIEETGITID